MKKVTVLALLAAVIAVAPAFAVQRNLTPSPTFVFTGASAAPAGTGPASTNTNDSCDIGVTPAATLLLPYFEVSGGAAGTGPTTLFTITNTSRFPQIAHVTVFTDWSAPVLDFNLFLTGYDVAPINLYDVIFRGSIASPALPSTTPGVATGITGGFTTPAANNANPNILGTFATDCAPMLGQPLTLPNANLTFVQAALTTGTGSNCASQIGGNHSTAGPGGTPAAIGYLTVDLVDDCNTLSPVDGGLYMNHILYDNVLMGDYQQLGPSPQGAAGTGFDAGGNPMVHIRAVPEGGRSIANAGVVVPTNLPFTFYNRYENIAGTTINMDRRQPLPSQWAARWVGGSLTSGGVSVSYNTDFKIWREGFTGAGNNCAVTNAAGSNSAIPVTAIRFDQHENSFGSTVGCPVSPCSGPSTATLPETQRVAAGTTTGTSSANAAFPPFTGSNTDVGGWMYLNLANGNTGAAETSERAGFGGGATVPVGTAPLATGTAFIRSTSSNWVIVSMFGSLGTQRLAVDFDAAWLGNGCTPAPAAGATIGPQPFGEPTGNLVCNPISTPVCPANTAVPVPNP